MNDILKWAGPRLLVPVTLDALVVTQADPTSKFSIQSLDLKNKYSNFSPISPELFRENPEEELPQPGIHVNWALPDGMTKGLVNKNGAVEYPYLPNRWMITRFCAEDASLQRSWIVKSDELYDEERPEQRVHPQFITNNNGVPEIKYIGSWYALEDFKEDSQSARLILTAVGNSDPLFTAYTGNNAFVYSFIDEFLDSNAFNFSYMVAGWFSNPEYDILYPTPKTGEAWKDRETWLATMDRLQWAAGNQQQDGDYDLTKAVEAGQKYLKENGISPIPGIAGKYCGQTLCHGLIFDIKWPGAGETAPSGVPDPIQSPPYIAAANAATDCLSAFMQWQLNYNSATRHDHPEDVHVEVMLEAFSHKLLNQPGGVYDTPELNAAIRETWFGKMPGGRIWVAQAPPKAGALNPKDSGGGSMAELPAELAKELAALNTLQHNYDKKTRELVTMQRQLYANWLKYNMARNMVRPPVPVATLLDILERSATAVKEVMDALPIENEAIKKTETALEIKLGENFNLKDKPAPEFYRPNDPVVLVNNAKRSFKRGEDIIYSDQDDYLFTRFSGQFVTCIKVDPVDGENRPGESKVIYAKNIFPALQKSAEVPLEVYPLLYEAYLLNPAFTRQIAAAASAPDAPGPKLLEQVKLKQTLVWNKSPKTPIDQRSLEELAGFNPGDELFRCPSKIGVWAWNAPWTPLYLEWEVTFKPVADMNQWVFDGNDYNWNTTEGLPTDGDMFLRGRSLLTPKEAITVQARLKEFINDFQGNIPKDFVPLQDVLNGAGNWDVLSQTLTGFSQQMLQWDIEQFGRQPLDKYRDGVGNEAHGMLFADYEEKFYPLRAGFVFIKRLWIVDDFGQVYDLTFGKDGMNAIPGKGVRPGKYEIVANLPTCFQLPPRLVQGARLNLNFLSASSDSVLSGQSADTSPVCGWILPNHLNRSLMVYDNEGTFAGEVMPMGATGQYHAQWVPAPFTGSSTADIENAHLRKFVLGLLDVTAGDQGTPDSAKALKNLLQVIDETLSTVDPMGERNNQSLSILVGRPIAVVRAAMGLELYGKAATNLAWPKTNSADDGHVHDHHFPVQIGSTRLGKDGVMGYFVGNDYSRFTTVHDGEVKDPPAKPYVVNTYTDVTVDGDPKLITLLLDPRGDIHCSSGILPVLAKELPEVYVGKVLDDMLVEFKAGPLLVDKKQWWLPLPAGVGQNWGWLQPDTEVAEKWTEVANLVPANAVPQFSGNTQTLVEGRLKLTGVLGDTVLILSFEITGEKQPYKVKAGTEIKLSWTSQGGTTAELSAAGVRVTGLPVNQTEYKYKVAQKQDIILKIGNGKTTADQKISIEIL